MRKKRGRRVLKGVLWGLVIVLVLGAGGIIAWSQIGVMAAEPEPLASVRENPEITVEDAAQGIVLAPADGESDLGLVFVPGAKVDPWGYAAILQGLAEEGITVVITRPWLNLAFFDPRGLDSFTSAAPDIDEWSVGGHSLGGVRACQLAADADALVLFGSYCATDLSATDLPVLSLAGSADGLSTPEKIDDVRDQLPTDAEMIEIDGASHASFGDYGPQAGDGTPTISSEKMHAEVTDRVGAFLENLPR
ncbi:alpha/beta hydrolase [Microbacterium sp. SA39]|uniref:alpha/beta hydrolase n=1 Tax=Microbacterium sp. SA39 TaxID=1263625 RepID=UPI0005FA0A7E|nr:alpha/beta hydrolase [Microbacterium sp. SA39]KJQ54549.1 Alpha/beta hydrolase family protein [Microbacterium sp. SA39]